MDAIAVPNNTLVVAYNDSPSKRSPLRLATSTDGGLTWTKGALIEDDPEGSFHYPALLYDAKKVGTHLIPLPTYFTQSPHPSSRVSAASNHVESQAEVRGLWRPD